MKVKVVKWCRKKWNKHNLMYIYHKQCEIKQKKSMKQLKRPTSLISHWFSVERDESYANANAETVGQNQLF